MKKWLILVIITLGISLTFSTCKRNSEFKLIFLDGLWLDQTWNYSIDTSLTAPLHWVFSAKQKNARIIEVPENDFGFIENEIVIQGLRKEGNTSYSGFGTIKGVESSFYQNVNVEIIEIDENHIRLEYDCELCTENIFVLERI